MTASGTLVEPAYQSFPSFAETLGPEVADLASLAGFAPDPEQALCLDALFGFDAADRSVAFELAVVCCRQNMKTGLFKQAALGWLFITEQRLVVWSAHEFRTAQEAFRDMEELISGCDVMRRRVRNVYRGNGDEAVELLSGARLIFKTRTKGGGRGLTGDKVILDEAFALQPMHMGALLPTLSARPDPQVVYGSSAGLAESAVLRGMRDRGRAGTDKGLAYFEWCAEPGGCQLEQCDHALTAPGCALDDPGQWQRGNPAMGRRITAEYIAKERRAMPPLEFARERLGWWDDPALEAIAINPAAWEAVTRPDAAALSVGAFAVEVALDRASASIGMAGPARHPMHGDDLHVEMVDSRRGTAWLPLRCHELNERHGPAPFVIDGGGPAAPLIEDLTAAGLELIVVNATDLGRACAGMVDAVTDKTITHGPQPELDTAVRGAKKRPLGDGGFAFGRKASTVDITPLVAVTLAHWAVTNRPAVNVLNSIW